MGQDDVSPAIEVGMATRGRLPAIQEGFPRTGTEWDFSSATSGNPISLFGFSGDLGDELVDGLLHCFGWFAGGVVPPICNQSTLP